MGLLTDRDRKTPPATAAGPAAGPAAGSPVDEGPDPSTRSYHVEIFLMCFAALLLEIAYTRVVSFKLFYYYTYLVIGLALLGIGSGGVFVAISKRLRSASTDAIIMWGCLLGAASVGVGYLVVAFVQTDSIAIFNYGTKTSVKNFGLLIVMCLALFASFVAVGVMLATLFGRRSEQIGRLYFADLLGAGVACAAVVPLLGWIGPPATIVFAGLVLALIGLRLALHHPVGRVVGAVLSLVLVAGVVAPSILPDPEPDALKPVPPAEDVRYSSWSPLFRVDVLDSIGARLLLHDGLVGSRMDEFDGDVSTLSRYDTDPRVLPFAALGDPPSNELIIGAAGGNEILASLHFGTEKMDAIELNPVTYELVTDTMADYSGHLAEIPNVNYVKDEGRSYLARGDEQYDLIWYPAPDSYSATNAATSGAFVLSESYLYTREAIEESFEHLTDDGIIAAQFGEVNYDAKPNRTARYVATARDALKEIGVENPADHIIVVTSPTEPPGALATILVKPEPFTDAEVDRVLESMADVPGATLRYAPGNAVKGDPVTQLSTLPDDELDAFYDSYPFYVEPVTDDTPFFWNFRQFPDVISGFGDKVAAGDPEVAIGERVLLMLLFIALLFAAVFLLLPFVAIRDIWKQLPRKRISAVYFAALGLGFIFFEITLIQKLTLFLGYPTLSLTVTLASLLIFTGVGALLSGRYADRVERVVPLMIGALAALTVFYLVGLPAVTDAGLGWPVAVRVVVAFLVLAPLGICLGTFMPVGLGTVAGSTDYPREYVAWGWAVNGFASVVGAVLSTILAMSFGFRVVLIVALAAVRRRVPRACACSCARRTSAVAAA